MTDSSGLGKSLVEQILFEERDTAVRALACLREITEPLVTSLVKAVELGIEGYAETLQVWVIWECMTCHSRADSRETKIMGHEAGCLVQAYQNLTLALDIQQKDKKEVLRA